MNKSIWKFPLETEDTTTIIMPENAEILTVQVQRDIVCLWALVDPNASREPRTIQIIGTGHPIDGKVNRKYIGTYQLMEGALVFHVFERL